MDQVISAAQTIAVNLLQQLAAIFGKDLGVAVVVTIAAWMIVERGTPPAWPAWRNRLASSMLGLGLTVLGHLAVPALSYGPGGRGIAAAAFYGLLAGGAAWPFHDLIARRWFPDWLLRSGSAGAPPATPGADA